MKKIHRVLLICFSFIFVHKSSTNMPQVSSAITYELNGGRFGDNLESFARAKYIGWLNGIPVRVFPFPYADHLMLYELEQLLCVEDFDNVVRLSSMYGPFRKYSNTLYINHWRVKVPINWNDLGFIEELKKVIAPRHDMNLVDIPEGYLSVAVHVRTGGGYSADNQQEKERCPLRFVSDEFYISQIGLIAEMYPDREIYVHIFTDHKNPSEVVEKYSKALQNDRLTFACQSGENAHNLNVL